jgi:ribosome-binding protein aMBF1 (putative translation factor)
MMNTEKRKRLEASGWVSGDAADFLGMSPEEARLLKIKLNLAREIESQRKKKGLSQTTLAARNDMKQPNFARLEKNPERVTMDMLFKILLSLGNSPKRIAALF